MDLGRAFTYFSEDVDWLKKVLIGGIVTLIPIVGFAMTGYWLTEAKRVYEGRELPLPEWDDFAAYFVKGLIAFVGQLIYALPIILLWCCAIVVTGAVGGAAGAADQRGGTAGGLASIVFFCAVCLIALYALVLIVFAPALLTRYAITDEFGALFQIGPAWQMIQANVGNYVVALLGYLIAGVIASLGLIACGIGVAFTSFWAALVAGYLFGSFARGTSVAGPGMPMTPPPMEPMTPQA